MPTIFSNIEQKGSYGTITVAELHERLDNGEEVMLIDVREPLEYEMARLEGARLLPLSRFPEWVETLNPDDEMVFMCHHGIRSAQVCAFLVRQGFKKIYNLAGGIDRWSREVDRSVPLY
jgi:rhodanese-related sulfurtransferase